MLHPQMAVNSWRTSRSCVSGLKVKAMSLDEVREQFEQIGDSWQSNLNEWHDLVTRSLPALAFQAIDMGDSALAAQISALQEKIAVQIDRSS